LRVKRGQAAMTAELLKFGGKVLTFGRASMAAQLHK
jgi:hypothetical protein